MTFQNNLENRLEIVKEARRWIGTPYHHSGRLIGVGCDCGGMLYEIYSKFFGPFKPFPKKYMPDWALHRDNEIYLDFVKQYGKEVSSPNIGDLVLFRVGRNYSHGTLYSEKNTYIHAYGRTGRGSVVESPLAFFTLGKRLRTFKCFDLFRE